MSDSTNTITTRDAAALAYAPDHPAPTQAGDKQRWLVRAGFRAGWDACLASITHDLQPEDYLTPYEHELLTDVKKLERQLAALKADSPAVRR